MNKTYLDTARMLVQVLILRQEVIRTQGSLNT
jgi:hypothetical protein